MKNKQSFRYAATLTALIFTCVPTWYSPALQADTGFSMKIMDAMSIAGGGTVVTGKVDTGSIGVGETVCVPLTSGTSAGRTVGGIEQFSKLLERARAGQHVGILVRDVDEEVVSRGSNLTGGCAADPGGTIDDQLTETHG